MRAIKFRIWDTKHDYWAEAPFYAIGLDGSIRVGAHQSTEPERYIFQQFTGLLDCSGREIYEGDVIKTEGDIKPLPVIFEDGAFQIAGIGYYMNKARVSEWCIEVIGNIYEDPELLRQEGV